MAGGEVGRKVKRASDDGDEDRGGGFPPLHVAILIAPSHSPLALAGLHDRSHSECSIHLHGTTPISQLSFDAKVL